MDRGVYINWLVTYRNACGGIVGCWKSLTVSRAVCFWHAKHVSELHPWVLCSGVVVNVVLRAKQAIQT